jgi:hypothetical protein
MELDGGTVTAIGTVVLAAASGICEVVRRVGKSIMVHIYALDAKLEDCNNKHAAERYRTGALEATVNILSERQPPEIRDRVKQTLATANEKAEEVTSTIPTKGTR